MNDLEIRPIRPEDRAPVDALTVRFWGGTRVVDVDGATETSGLPGAVALRDGVFAGAVTWQPAGDALKILTIASLHEGIGTGRALVAAAEAEARRLGAARVVLFTTNDNLRALALYQRAGFALTALHPGAVTRLRALKPAIPEVAGNGIPIRDLIELEKRLG
jgi:ribosomal protein S18 acetylase RimI-like enzyme